jgi:hypothetical protein
MNTKIKYLVTDSVVVTPVCKLTKSVRNSVLDSVRSSANNNVWDYVWHVIRGSVIDGFVHDLLHHSDSEIQLRNIVILTKNSVAESARHYFETNE